MRLLPAYFVAVFITLGSQLAAEDWPQWRGPTGDNHAAAGATAPNQWSESEGLAWKTPVLGRGHSSPTLVGNRIYLTTADDAAGTQSLLIFDRQTGELLAQPVVHEGGLSQNVHPNNTNASPTVASDGKRVFALFHNNNAAWITAFTLEGQQIWQKRALEFDPQRFKFGFGSSPVVADGLVIVTSEYDGPESGLVAFDCASGEQRWKTPRPESLSYSSVARVQTGGKLQLMLSGNQQIAAYEPSSGEELWSTPGTTYATCGTMVWDEGLGLAFASGGFPETFTLAVEMSGEHKIVWKNQARCYEQSLLLADGYLYAVTDRGVAYCWRARDGEQMWKQRIGGSFSSSPVLVGSEIYVASEKGTIFVYEANPEEFQSLGENQLGDEAFATPTPADGRLYHRYTKMVDGKRQEFLAAIGK
ncbi:outer membrane protein assembly factor BamB family protein [Adhaeretor mobilis]|uniref:Outer membrane biogenesis protein BamB n=1 Tax=Adhaeretor mobilis TaxID=1930276 RepID=A0A517MYL8_9BACT|nr:PQQ-binding-like beta-propeller repeat protein [Adhaeretor mobilis]QDS99975.1 outer membrane biogenesis protein BamB [Adhaeretor mobilis]